jgi:hypothetical protein
VDDVANSGKDFDTACFVSFDMRGPVAVEIQAESPLECASVHPISAGIEASVDGRTVTFDLDRPRHLTIEFNGAPEGCLHLFANPPEENRPDPNDPDVIFFGPGVHEIDRLVVGDGQTLYVAGGALLRTFVSPEETPDPDLPHWFARLGSSIEMRGRGCAVRGRGIIDGSLCPPHTKNLFSVTGSDVTIEIQGFDADHRIDGVQMQNVVLEGNPLSRADVSTNAYVGNLRIENAC